MCQRSKEIIPGLLRSMNKMEAELDRLKENSRCQQSKVRKLRMYLIIHWVAIVMWLFLFKSGGEGPK